MTEEPLKTPWDDSRKVVVLNKKLQLAKRKIELAAISEDWSKAEEARDLLHEMIEVEPKPVTEEQKESLDNHEKNVNPDVDLPTAAYSFVVEDANLDSDENHRVIKWSNPEDSHSIEGIRHKDHTVKDVEELVRRQDVEQALENLDSNIRAMIKEHDRDVPYFVYDLIKELKEEVQKE